MEAWEVRDDDAHADGRDARRRASASREIRSVDVRGISDLWSGATWDLSYTSLI